MVETNKLGSLRWSHFFRPTEDELKELQDYYHFHPLDIEDCKSPINLRPKIDSYQNYHFLILHFPEMELQGQFIETRELKVFWAKDYLITIGKSNWLVKEIFSQDTTPEANASEETSDRLLYRIIEYLMEDTQRLVGIVDKSVDDCGKELFSRKPERTIEKISITRKNVILLNTILKPQLVLFNKLQSGAIKGFANEMEDYWGNILDSFQRSWDIIEDDRELISGYSKTFDSLQVHKTNQVMRILTLVASMFLPLLFLSMIPAMFVGTTPAEHRPFVVAELITMGAIVLFVWIYFRIRRWR